MNVITIRYYTIVVYVSDSVCSAWVIIIHLGTTVTFYGTALFGELCHVEIVVSLCDTLPSHHEHVTNMFMV